MPANQRGLALYNELTGKAWVYAEELDVDLLASDHGVSYFLEWVKARFMAIEITQVSHMMGDLFKRCRRRGDQSVRDFNVEFERLVLRLKEVQCEIPPLIKGWLYLDKLRLSEHEELTLLSSVNNQFDAKRLQQAALLQDRAIRRPASSSEKVPWKEGKRWGTKHSVHMTDALESSDESAPDEEELVSEDVACEAHEAYMTYQSAKSRYREALKGRGADVDEIKKRSEERLRLAKQRSFCSACKRKGHWHKDPECPLRGRRPVDERQQEAHVTVHSAQMCTTVHACYAMDNQETQVTDFLAGGLLAIVDTACTKAVAGHGWFENFCDMCDKLGFMVETYDHEEFFKFGASRVHTSSFGVAAWFAIRGRWFQVRVAIVPCGVPLLFSRPILAALGMHYDLAAQRVQLSSLGLDDVPLHTSQSGHPALLVNEYEGKKPPRGRIGLGDDLYLPDERAYMDAQSHDMDGLKPLFYPKIMAKEVQLMLQSSQTLGGAGYFCWWKHAKLSRDFWIETHTEFIRVHVVPRRGLFDPSSWKTQLVGLKDVLLKRLDGSRRTEAISCLSEGTAVHVFSDANFEHVKNVLEQPWIGRSRFPKFEGQVSLIVTTADAHSSPLDAIPDSLAMEHEERPTVGRVGRTGGDSSPVLDGAGASIHPCGAEAIGETCAGRGQDEGIDQDDPPAAGRGGEEGQPRAACKTDSRPDDEASSRLSEHARMHSHAVREVQGLDVQRGARRLHPMGDERGEGQPQCSRGSGALCDLGLSGAGAPSRDTWLAQEEGSGKRSRGAGCDSAAAGEVRSGSFELLGSIVGESDVAGRLCPEGRGDRHRHRHRRRPSGGRGRDHPCSGEPVGSIEEEDECQEVKTSEETHEFSGGSEDEENKEDYRVFLAALKDEVKYDMGTNNHLDAIHGMEDVDQKETMSAYEDKAWAMPNFNENSNAQGVEEYNDGTINSQDIHPGSDEDTDNETTSGSADDGRSRSPLGRDEVKARIQAGMKRKRFESRSTKKKIMDTAQQIFGVLATCSLAMGLWTQEVMGDPLWDAWSVLQSSHPVPDDGRADCLELFAGEANISGVFASRQKGVLEPRDLRYNHDLRKSRAQEEVIEEMWENKPRLVWMAPPCTAWCQFSHLNYTPQELRRKRAREQSLVRFTHRVFELQCDLGGIVVVENPRTSALWRQAPLCHVVRRPEVCFADLDLCRYGMSSVVDGSPLRKTISLLTNNTIFAKNIEARCDKSHHHRPIQGKDTAASAIYPPAFARAVFKAFCQATSQKQIEIQYPTHTVAHHGPQPGEEPLGADSISFKGKVKPMIAATLKRIHQNLGHPPQKELIRHLRLAGASDAVLRAAEQMVCRTCEKSTKAKLARPAHPAVVLDFNEVVAADIIWFDTTESTGLPALNIVDLASTYQVVVPLQGTSAEEVGSAMIRGWMNWAGAPKHLLVDLDSAFKGHFLQLMNERSVIVRCAAAQAHWQNGVAERHGGSWKEIFAKLVEDHAIMDYEVEEAVAATSDAKNQLRNRSGYSPRQWVFGSSMRNTGDLFDGPEELSSLEHITVDEKAARRHQIKMAARAAFFQCQSKQALDRAIAHKSRVEQRSFEAGELVYAFREYLGKKRWLGPCTVVGREGQNYWLARGGRCLLCAPEHVRTALHEEVNEGLRIKMAMREVKQLMEQDEEEDEFDEIDFESPPQPHGAQGSGPVEMDVENAIDPVEERARQLQIAARKAHVLDDVPVSIKKAKIHRPFLTKRTISAKAQEKQLDKELPWHMIPPEEKPLYVEAEEKQWQEHLQFEAVRPLSVEESNEVIATVPAERILDCRFLYRDKNRAKRRRDKDLGPKAKARLCVAGQRDPDWGALNCPQMLPRSRDIPSSCRCSSLWHVGGGLVLEISVRHSSMASPRLEDCTLDSRREESRRCSLGRSLRS